MTKITLKNVKILYPSLFEEAVFDGEKIGYQALFILEKDGHKGQIDNIKNLIKELVSDKFRGVKIKDDRMGLRDGDDDDKPFLQNCYTIKASNKLYKPLVIDGMRRDINVEDRLIYSGAIVNAIISLRTYDHKGNRGVSASLQAVQFVKHGGVIETGSRVKADEFDILESDESNTVEDIFG